MKKISLLSIVTLLLIQTTVRGVLWSSNECLDDALQHVDMVVAGRIINIGYRYRFRASGGGNPPDIGFKVEQVLFSDPELPKEEFITFQKLRLSWPRELVPFEAGTFCVLLLDHRTPEPIENVDSKLIYVDIRRIFGDDWNPYWPTVVGLSAREFPQIKDRESIRTFLRTELIRELEREMPLARRRRLIMQMTPILEAGDVSALLPDLRSENDWVRRAALAACVKATKDTKYVELAASELREFFATTKPEARVKDPAFGQREVSAYWVPFENFDFLSSDFLEAQSAGNDALARLEVFLPLYRVVAAQPQAGYDALSHGLRPLCQLGKRRDLALLWKSRNQTGIECRQEIVMAISRILNLGIPELSVDEFKEREKEVVDQVESALKSIGIVD